MFTKIKDVFFQDVKVRDSGSSFNPISGQGYQNDKTSQTFWATNTFYNNRAYLENAYVNSWACAKFIDIPIDDQFLVPRIFKDLDDEKEKQLKEEIERLQIDVQINKAMKSARLYGTALLLMVTTDAPLDQPLNVDILGEGDLKSLLVVDRFYASVMERELDLASPNFGKPITYLVNFLYRPGIVVHHSRIVRIDGIAPITNNYWINYLIDWGISNLVTAIGPIQDEESALTCASQLMQEASIPIVSADGLQDSLSGAPDADVSVQNFAQTFNQLKSIFRTTFIDSRSTVTRLDVNMRQMPEMIDRMWTRLCAAADVPQTRFMGQSPAGLNSTGAGDMKNYAVMIGSKQVRELKPIYDKLDLILAKHLGLKENIQYEFPSLIGVTEAEQAAAKFQNAQADNIYMMGGVLGEDEVRQNLANTDAYQIDLNKPMDTGPAPQATVNALVNKIKNGDPEAANINKVGPGQEAESPDKGAVSAKEAPNNTASAPKNK